MIKKVFGVGINDANYTVKIQESYYIEGKRKRRTTFECPYYVKWKSMLMRCYSEGYLNKNPTYKDCLVCDEWLTFSNFKSWMETQDWEGKQLDKDLLFRGNRVYSPTTCLFVPKDVNYFMLTCKASRGDTPLGVTHCSRTNHIVAYIRDFSGKELNLGVFSSYSSAHFAWLYHKISNCKQLLIKHSSSRDVVKGLTAVLYRLEENFTNKVVCDVL